MREIVHLQAGQCGNQIGAKVSGEELNFSEKFCRERPLLAKAGRQSWLLRWHQLRN